MMLGTSDCLNAVGDNLSALKGKSHALMTCQKHNRIIVGWVLVPSPPIVIASLTLQYT